MDVDVDERDHVDAADHEVDHESARDHNKRDHVDAADHKSARDHVEVDHESARDHNESQTSRRKRMLATIMLKHCMTPILTI